MTEYGRYDQIPRDNRLCSFCRANENEDDIHLHLIFQLPEIFYSKGQINNKVQFYVHKFKHLPPIEVIKELKNPCNYFVIFNLENLSYLALIYVANC